MIPKAEKPGIFYSYLSTVRAIWKDHLFDQIFIRELIVTLILITTILIFFAHFINTIEARDGISFTDPILKLFRPINLSIIAGLISLLNDPSKLLFVLQTYVVLLIIRIITLSLLPLNPPQNMIPLIDPIVSNLGTGQLLTKDLFFSGHTATMFLLFLVIKNIKLRITFFAFFIILAFALLIQHVHYSIDVISAPFFSFASFRMVLNIKNKLFNFKS
jgi:PAP2 superfamily C-terminal